MRVSPICFTWLLGLLLALTGSTGEAASHVAKVVGVSDGDTIRLLTGRTTQVLRLWGIDCPERSQAFGSRARQFTRDLVAGQSVRVTSYGSDRYGRALGVVTLRDGRVLNEELLKAGLAWWAKPFAEKEASYARFEAEARRARRGLWTDPHPEPPWEFRRSHTRQSELIAPGILFGGNAWA